MKKATSNAAQRAFDATEEHPSIWDAFEMGAKHGLAIAAKAAEKSWPGGYIPWNEDHGVLRGKDAAIDAIKRLKV